MNIERKLGNVGDPVAPLPSLQISEWENLYSSHGAFRHNARRDLYMRLHQSSMDGDDCQQRLVLSVLSQDENSLDPWLIRRIMEATPADDEAADTLIARTVQSLRAIDIKNAPHYVALGLSFMASRGRSREAYEEGQQFVLEAGFGQSSRFLGFLGFLAFDAASDPTHTALYLRKAQEELAAAVDMGNTDVDVHYLLFKVLLQLNQRKSGLLRAQQFIERHLDPLLHAKQADTTYDLQATLSRFVPLWRGRCGGLVLPQPHDMWAAYLMEVFQEVVAAEDGDGEGEEEGEEEDSEARGRGNSIASVQSSVSASLAGAATKRQRVGANAFAPFTPFGLLQRIKVIAPLSKWLMHSSMSLHLKAAVGSFEAAGAMLEGLEKRAPKANAVLALPTTRTAAELAKRRLAAYRPVYKGVYEVAPLVPTPWLAGCLCDVIEAGGPVEGYAALSPRLGSAVAEAWSLLGKLLLLSRRMPTVLADGRKDCVVAAEEVVLQRLLKAREEAEGLAPAPAVGVEGGEEDPNDVIGWLQSQKMQWREWLLPLPQVSTVAANTRAMQVPAWANRCPPSCFVGICLAGAVLGLQERTRRIEAAYERHRLRLNRDSRALKGAILAMQHAYSHNTNGGIWLMPRWLEEVSLSPGALAFLRSTFQLPHAIPLLRRSDPQGARIVGTGSKLKFRGFGGMKERGGEVGRWWLLLRLRGFSWAAAAVDGLVIPPGYSGSMCGAITRKAQATARGLQKEGEARNTECMKEILSAWDKAMALRLRVRRVIHGSGESEGSSREEWGEGEGREEDVLSHTGSSDSLFSVLV